MKLRVRMPLLVLLLAIGVSCGRAHAQQSAEPTTKELLRVLHITAFRVRLPEREGDVWDFKPLKKEDLKEAGTNPVGLSKNTGLLSLREIEAGVFEFTLPERGGASSQGKIELCNILTCSGQYSITWLKRPRYSTDGTQCVLGTFSNLGEGQPSAFLVLELASSKPSKSPN